MVFRFKVLPLKINIKNTFLKYVFITGVGAIFMLNDFSLFHVIENLIQYSTIDFEVSILENLQSEALFGYLVISFCAGFAILQLSIYTYIIDILFNNNLRSLLALWLN